jgi:hypothetical protein
MKVKFIGAFMFALFLLNCEKNGQLPSGKIVFYTNAQAMVNCGPFKVNVFIGDEKVGSIEEPFTEDNLPDCSNSSYTLVVHKEPGHYTCKAVGCNSLECIKSFEVVVDSCSYVFLDISDFN